MLRYTVIRLFQTVIVLLLVSILTFSLLLLIGDPVSVMASRGEALDPEQLDNLRRELGLDKPIPVQYAMWLGKAIRGDFGRSLMTQRPVIDELKERLPVTLQLGVTAILLSLLIAIPTGIMSAYKRGSKLDIAATLVAVGGVAMPEFWLGILLIILFGVFLDWLPIYGFINLWDNPIESLKHLVLPALTLATSMTTVIMRQMRSAALEVFAQDYIRTARAKGLRERTVIWRHVLKNALPPVVTLMGILIGRLMGGAVIVESIFSISGIGRLLVNSIFSFDFPVTQACIFLIAFGVCICNLIVDVTYGYFDPRIKHQKT